jgi:hypothetical protein
MMPSFALELFAPISSDAAASVQDLAAQRESNESHTSVTSYNLAERQGSAPPRPAVIDLRLHVPCSLHNPGLDLLVKRPGM